MSDFDETPVTSGILFVSATGMTAIVAELQNAPEKRHDFVALDQLLGGVHGIGRLAAAVLDDRLDLFAEHAAFGVAFLDRELRAGDIGAAVIGDRAGQRLDHADLDRLLRRRLAREQGECKTCCDDRLHFIFPSPLGVRCLQDRSVIAACPLFAATMRRSCL
jgi:hypothetical protein